MDTETSAEAVAPTPIIVTMISYTIVGVVVSVLLGFVTFAAALWASVVLWIAEYFRNYRDVPPNSAVVCIPRKGDPVAYFQGERFYPKKTPPRPINWSYKASPYSPDRATIKTSVIPLRVIYHNPASITVCAKHQVVASYAFGTHIVDPIAATAAVGVDVMQLMEAEIEQLIRQYSDRTDWSGLITNDARGNRLRRLSVELVKAIKILFVEKFKGFVLTHVKLDWEFGPNTFPPTYVF